MTNYTNNFNLPLSLSVWLLDDGYDHSAVADPNTFSVTEIINPVRQVILGRRVRALPSDEQIPVDIMSLYNARMGQSAHTAIEDAWTGDQLANHLVKLGISDKVAQRVKVNPKPEDISEDDYVIYMEQRRTIPISGTPYKLTGQYDFNFAGQLEDFKNTKTYSITMGLNDHHYIVQGSCYKYLFPDQITSQTSRISFMFSDWMASRVGSPNYPAAAIDSKEFTLMSRFQTETFIKTRFAEIEKYFNAPETELPECTPEELWMKPDEFKYYANPTNTSRATKRFDNLADANAHLASKGKGIVKTFKGSVGKCKYCNAFALCTQKDKYILSGQLEI